jgi:hypothetical protein
MLQNNPFIKLLEPVFTNPVVDDIMCWWFDRYMEAFMHTYYFPFFIAGDMDEITAMFKGKPGR